MTTWHNPQRTIRPSYEAEHRPIAKRNTQEATRNLVRFRDLKTGAAIDADGDEGERQRALYKQSLFDADILRHHDTDGIALGYRYDGSPIVIPDGTRRPTTPMRDYVPTARPGHCAPHAWLDGGPPPAAGVRLPHGRSMLDLYGDGFVILSFGADAEADALAGAAAARRVPLAVAPIAEPEIAALYGARLVLVRPDGHVAWPGDRAPADAASVVDRVRGARVD